MILLMIDLTPSEAAVQAGRCSAVFMLLDGKLDSFLGVVLHPTTKMIPIPIVREARSAERREKLIAFMVQSFTCAVVA